MFHKTGIMLSWYSHIITQGFILELIPFYQGGRQTVFPRYSKGTEGLFLIDKYYTGIYLLLHSSKIYSQKHLHFKLRYSILY